MKLFFVSILSFFWCQTTAQPGYYAGASTGDFTINKILNHSFSSASFTQFKNKLLIIDFFGTWCAPCIKALPHLAALKEKYKNDINILLVSEETPAVLESFINKRRPFVFPVVADEEKKFIKLFQPPSYPYTVVIGKNNQILAIPSQEEMTEENINIWLSQQEKNMVAIPPAKAPVIPDGGIGSSNPGDSKNNLVKLSQQFMYAARTGDSTADFITQLKELGFPALQSSLSSDEDKKAFWINLYNAYTQVALKNNPDQYKKRSKFFGRQQIEIAGKKFSLDEIEHGILRRSKIKWSLGYLNKLFPGKTERKLRVNKLDYRLHFALNCGAKSCPPIAFYSPENINQQLDAATKAYLRAEAAYDIHTNTVKLPAVMSWFRRDFGGKKEMIQLLQQLSIVPAGKKPTIKFKKYDWTLYLQNYKS